MFDGVQSPLTQTVRPWVVRRAVGRTHGGARAFFHDRGAPVQHETSPVAGHELVKLLVDRGYHPIEYTSVLYQPISVEAAPEARNPSIQVQPIESVEHGVWTRTFVDGWSDAADLGDFLHEAGRVQAHVAGAHRFLAEGRGTSCRGGRALHPRQRRASGRRQHDSIRETKGCAAGPLNARLRFAAAAGCDLAMMGAMPGSGSQRNAERNGFRIAYTRVKWLLK